MTVTEEGTMFGLDVTGAAHVPGHVLREWRHEYRELNEDRLGWCMLWEPFLAEKLAAYGNTDPQPARLPGGAH